MVFAVLRPGKLDYIGPRGLPGLWQLLACSGLAHASTVLNLYPRNLRITTKPNTTMNIGIHGLKNGPSTTGNPSGTGRGNNPPGGPRGK